MRRIVALWVGTVAAAGLAGAAAAAADEKGVGAFEAQGDVGTVLHRGSATFDGAGGRYTVAGSGANMWATRDAFHYVWKQGSGDLSVAADVAFVGQGKDPHRKACLVIRQGLDADSAYVDVAVHGDGLTSLQFRAAKGDATHEVQANVKAPKRVRLVKQGGYARLDVAAEGGEPAFSGAAARVAFREPFYVGLAVCAHDPDVTETAAFSRVEVAPVRADPAARPMLYSTLETQTISSTDRRVVLVTAGRIEAPNWSRDGGSLLYNGGGRVFRVPAAGGAPVAVDTGFATRCNNDHGLSPDGATLAISDQSQGDRKSRIYTVPLAGGAPKLVTPAGPSYWHGWSPDGKTLAFCGERGGEFDIYTVPVAGGAETRLTTAQGLDDGPDYTADGRQIYFNSNRTGLMQIWRMNADGSGQEQVTDDGLNDWFPHPSPDGRSVAFLSFEKGVVGHPENKEVALRLLDPATRQVRVLGEFFGGQGTINVPSWSPDGRRIAFVTYQLVP